jgi:hypothetical protein
MNGAHLDSIVLGQDSGMVIVSMGYDAYGNKIGTKNSNWIGTDSLPPIQRPLNTRQIYYAIDSVKTERAGYIIATAVDTSNGLVIDSLKVRIIGPKVRLEEVITRDLSGNGYLDALELHFSRPVTLPESFFDKTSIDGHFKITVQSNGKPLTLEIDSIVPVMNAGDSTTAVYLLRLVENTSEKTAQTNLRPQVSLLNPGEEIAATTAPLTATDGAGPVIWTVKKDADVTGNHANDKVTVTFSEDITDLNDAQLKVSTQPGELFNVWVWDATTKSFVSADTLFDGITKFSLVTNNSVTFNMENGENLLSAHFLSIDSTMGLMVDKSDNYPNQNNQQVRVKVIGAIGTITIGPNPTTPVMNHYEDVLTCHDPVEAYNWVRNEGAGTVMTADIVLPDSASLRDLVITASLMVFDEIGNLVYSRKSDDNIVPNDWLEDGIGGSTRQLVLYWNGMTDRRTKAAPGLYRSILFVKVSGLEGTKYTGNLGIAR